MKVFKASEKQLDQRLALDKRHDDRAFYRYFEPKENLPDGYYDLQDRIRHELEKIFWDNFDDGIDRSNQKPWKVRSNNFFFPAELRNYEQIQIEMSNRILGDRLIGLLMRYLEKCDSEYCVLGSVYDGEITGSKYVGRFLVNRHQIVVEETLARTWASKVRFMEIEKELSD